MEGVLERAVEHEEFPALKLLFQDDKVGVFLNEVWLDEIIALT